jgi:hypothetical protein
MNERGALLNVEGTLIREAGATSASYRRDQPVGVAPAPSYASAWSRVTVVTLCLWLALFLLEVTASVLLCGGRLVFTLDDPYIHLAVADQILSGGYGVNASEFSSPSSSILWPYLLALSEALRLGGLGPLLINASATAATLIVILRLFATVGMFDRADDRPIAYAAAGLTIFVTSAIALPMTGMEHSLHVWATVVTFSGLVAAAQGRTLKPSHFVALVLLPLIRFEGLALAGAAVVAFALLGRLRFAAAAAALIGLALSAYAVLMTARGLPLLPSSVLLKSRIAENAYEHRSLVGSIAQNLQGSLNNPYGQRLVLLGFAIASGAWWLRADRRAQIVCACVLAAIGAHLVMGQYGWFYRYEVYVIALAVLALVWIAASVRPQLSARGWLVGKSVLLLLMIFAGSPYLSAALITPFAARGVYEQQYQMGRFARDFYPHPVAVNDLGLVAYTNPNFVLDLWGLGSEDVRKARLVGQYGPSEMAALVDQHHVGLVMVYDSWFPQGLPASWTKIAVLHTSPVTAASGDVAFYRTPAGDQDEIMHALRSFEPTLPPRVSLEIFTH